MTTGIPLLLENEEDLLLEDGGNLYLEFKTSTSSDVLSFKGEAHGSLLGYVCQVVSSGSITSYNFQGTEFSFTPSIDSSVTISRNRSSDYSSTSEVSIDDLLPLKVWTPSLIEAEDRLSSHKLLWNSDEEIYVIFDGSIFTETTDNELYIDDDYSIRDHIILIDETGSFLPIPSDRVQLTMEADGDRVTLERKKGDSSYVTIRRGAVSSLTDGPLQDGDWTYRLTVADEAGNENSASATFTVEATPEPPTNVTASTTTTTEEVEVTLSGAESVSSDLSHYNVYKSSFNGKVVLNDTPHAQTNNLPYNDTISEEGTWRYLVRAVDTGGKEESNITELVTVICEFDEAGEPTTIKPGEPFNLYTISKADGKIDVNFTYDPADEQGDFGIAEEARIYYDSGTGTVDYTSPLGTLSLSKPTVEREWTYTTPALSEDSYKFTVRIATKENPDGIETTNTDTVTGTSDSTPPDKPSISGEVI